MSGMSPAPPRCPQCGGTRGHKFSCSQPRPWAANGTLGVAAPIAAGSGRPVLLLDVDGPINAYDMGSADRARTGTRVWTAMGLQLAVRDGLGALLLALTDVVDLAWATTWGHEANTRIAPILGLPALPVIECSSRRPCAGDWRVYFKTPAVLAWTAGRAFAWLDDEITDHDAAWLASQGAGPHLLRRVDPGTGIVQGDLDAVRAWATSPV